MLIDDFYTIRELKVVDQKLQATVLFNADHEVYQGHFPDQPVVPGVIQLQMVKELLEQHLKKNIVFSKMAQAKFINLMVPDAHPIQLTIAFNISEENLIQVDATIYREDSMYTKARITYRFSI